MDEVFLIGNLYASINGETISLGEDLDFTREIDIWSPDEHVQETYNFPLKNSGSLSYDINAEDLSFLNKLTQQWTPPETFWFEHEMPIMIQARWHKKKRINKKWLKRFGVRLDTVRRRDEGQVLTYNQDSGELEFETTGNKEYLWRPDQKRKYLKIEGV